MSDDPKKPQITQPSESTQIPGLPQRNSNADIGGRRSLSLEELAAPASAFGRTLAEMAEQRNRSSEQSAPDASQHVVEKTPELPGTKTLDYIGLGLLLAPPTVVVEMYVKGDSINWTKTVPATVVAWVAGGVVLAGAHRWQAWRSASGPILPFLTRAENKFWVRALIVAACMASALGLSSILSNDHGAKTETFITATPVAGQVTAEDIAKATAPIKAELETVKQQRDRAISELEAARRRPPPAQYPQAIGSISTLNFFSTAGAVWQRLPKGTAILITAAPENSLLQRNLLGIFEVGTRDVLNLRPDGGKLMIDPPNYATDLDAPRLPLTDQRGIVIHGEDTSENDLMNSLSRCFVTRRTARIVDGLAAYYKVPRLVWIEIGPGNPWKDYTECAG